MMYFQCDYVDGAHPALLKRLVETNSHRTSGYGLDPYCENARALIRRACGNPDVDVHFLVGGTQTNMTVIASILRPHQGVLAAETGHITCHETGAIEALGHKILALPSADGTITSAQVEAYYRDHLDSGVSEHTVQPGMVYISFPTEPGTLYTKAQLKELSDTCRRCGLPLYLDGARLAYGLAAPDNDLTLPDIAELCDIFYIGGTKCGAAFGEAVVITKDSLKKDFRYAIKQHGGMLAKGRLLGIQFEALFADGLYFHLCRNAVEQALRIRQALEEKGIPPYISSHTNQQFALLTKDQLAHLEKKYYLGIWDRTVEGRPIVRFCTCWATPDEEVDELTRDIKAL